MTDRTPYELLVELHELLMADLVRRLRAGDPPAEILAVAGRALRDNHVGADSDADRRQLRRLWRLQLETLLAAVDNTERPPSASVLAEVTRFLTINGTTKDLGSHLDESRAAAALSLMSRLPFAH